MPLISYNFRKIYRTGLEKSSKVLIFGEKTTRSSHFSHNKNFPQNPITISEKSISEKSSMQI